MANDAKAGSAHDASRERLAAIADFHPKAPPRPIRFVVLKGVVTTLKEAADIRNRDPKDLE